MPPKNPEDLKNRKKPEQKPTKAGRKKRIPKEVPQKGKSRLDVLKPYLLNRWVQLAAVLLLLSLILLLLMYTHLYLAELKKLSEKYRAVTRIQQFMVHYNESFEDKNELETMEGVRLLLNQINRQKGINTEVQASIETVIQMLQDGWIPFGGHLYYFYETIQTFYFANKTCRDQNSWVVYIQSRAEEDFLEAEVNRRSQTDDEGYWLGLTKTFVYTWINGVPLRYKFWAERYPGTPSAFRKVCAYITKCTEKRKCWKDNYCDQKKKWICKWKGDQRWF